MPPAGCGSTSLTALSEKARGRPARLVEKEFSSVGLCSIVRRLMDEIVCSFTLAEASRAAFQPEAVTPARGVKARPIRRKAYHMFEEMSRGLRNVFDITR